MGKLKILALWRRLAISTKIESNNAVMFGKDIELSIPHTRIQRMSVQEYQCFGATTLHLVIQRGATAGRNISTFRFFRAGNKQNTHYQGNKQASLRT